MDSQQDIKATIKKYHLPPTPLIPNSPHPLLHYSNVLLTRHSSNTSPSSTAPPTANTIALRAHNLFSTNNWEPQWIYRYGPTQQAHYHSRVHECMVVLCGEALITFGAADSEITPRDELVTTSPPAAKPSPAHGQGITLSAHAGDVFVIPAGIAHKTHHVTAGSEFALLTPGDGHGIIGREGKASDREVGDFLASADLDGFVMFGAYPASSTEGWDFAVGGEDVGDFEHVWSVSVPERDPMFGDRDIGLVGLWA